MLLAPNDFLCVHDMKTTLLCKNPLISNTPHTFDVTYTMYFNKSYVRSGWRWYDKQMGNMKRSILSVRNVGFNGTIHVLLGGEQRSNTLLSLQRMNVNITFLNHLCFPPPIWSSISGLVPLHNLKKSCILKRDALLLFSPHYIRDKSKAETCFMYFCKRCVFQSVPRILRQSEGCV